MDKQNHFEMRAGAFNKLVEKRRLWIIAEGERAQKLEVGDKVFFSNEQGNDSRIIATEITDIHLLPKNGNWPRQRVISLDADIWAITPNVTLEEIEEAGKETRTEFSPAPITLQEALPADVELKQPDGGTGGNVLSKETAKQEQRPPEKGGISSVEPV